MSNTLEPGQEPWNNEESFIVNAAGRDWQISRTADLESLWDEMDADDLDEDERIPYWTELWPSSTTLCAWLFERRAEIGGRACIDIGCGLGLTAMAAGVAGAKVVCMDYEFDAVRHALGNARLNGAPAPLATLMDWRYPALKKGAASFVWGSDVLYERRFAPAVARFMNHALAPGGKAWLADPGRNFFTEFEDAMADLPFIRTRREKRTAPWKGRQVTVYVHEFTKNSL